MSEKLGEALLDLDTNDRKFNAGIDRAEKSANALGKTLDGVRDRAINVGKALVVGTFVAYGVGIATAVRRLEEMRKASGQVDQALKNSGNTAQTSAKEIEAWADALENRTGRAAEEIMGVSANLASFGFGREQFFRALTLADDMSAAWGGDLKQSLEGLSRALDDPITGMAMLSKRGIQLTEEQKQLAQSFLEAGDKASAQGVVFEALESQVKGVAEAGFNGLTKAVAQTQKAWETAFEDMVQGNGEAADLRDTLVDLAETLSSPEFIGAVVGFGRLIVATINGIAQVAVGAATALSDLANLVGKAVNRGSLSEQAAALSREELVKERARAWEIISSPYSNSGAKERSQRWYDELTAQEIRLNTMDPAGPRGLDKNEFNSIFGPTPGSMAGFGDYDPYADFTYSGKSSGSAKTDKAAQLVESLKAERDLLREMDPVQQRLIQLRDQLATATTGQRDEVEALIKTIHEETQAWENSQAAAQLFGDWFMSSLEGLRKGTKSVIDVVNDLVDVLIKAVLQSMLLGQGPLAGLFGTSNAGGGLGGLFGGLAGLFAGGFYKGGLIPTGQFGIVGERGPEPVISTANGAMVLPNSSLGSMAGGDGGGRGDIYVTVEGSGLSQSEMTQAIADAIERFDRHQLPQRVADINADPLARG